MKTDSQADRQGFQSDDDKHTRGKMEKSPTKGSKTITGELVLDKEGNYFVKVTDGTEVRMHTDDTTPMTGQILKNDRIEAIINDPNHALSIRSTK